MTNPKSSYELFLKKLGESLQEVRKEQGLTQAELGLKSQRGQSAIGKIERMPATNIPLRVVYEIAATIPTSLSALFYQTEKKLEAGRTVTNNGESWPMMMRKVEGLPPKKREQVAKIIEQILST